MLSPADTSIERGSSVPLSCVTTGNQPAQWYKSNVPVVSNSQSYTSSRGNQYQVTTVILCNAGFDDAGVYVCGVDDGGIEQNESFALNVHGTYTAIHTHKHTHRRTHTHAHTHTHTQLQHVLEIYWEVHTRHPYLAHTTIKTALSNLQHQKSPSHFNTASPTPISELITVNGSDSNNVESDVMVCFVRNLLTILEHIDNGSAQNIAIR